MKILFVESYPHVIFGQQHTLLSILDETTARGHECVIGVTSEGVFVEKLRRCNHEVLMLPYPEKLSSYGGEIYRYKGVEKLKCYGQGVQYLWKLRKTLQQVRPHVIYCNDMRGLLTVGVAAKSLGIPVVIWDKLDKPHGWLDQLQLPLVSKNIVISQAVCAKYPLYQQKWFREKIVKITEGVDLTKGGEGIGGTFPGEMDDIYVAIVGSISERKGHDRLMNVWKDLLSKVPHLRLLVVGEASDEQEKAYQHQVYRSCGDRVHFLGVRSDVVDIMKSIDLLVVPSRNEGMGMVIIEAMAAGKPVIGANTGGIPEVIVDGETGLLFEGDDGDQLVDNVVRLALDAELRIRMGEAGRDRVVKRFNRSTQMVEVVNLIESIAK